MRFAKSLTNDIRVRIGKSYLETGEKQKALNYFKKHLQHRQRGLFSNYTKREIEKLIANSLRSASVSIKVPKV